MQQFGRYQVLETIARGGMGEVLKARDPELQRDVAIKVLLAGEFAAPVAKRRFAGEAAALVKVLHSNVVRLFDHGVSSGGAPFLVMELLQGSSLAQRLERAGPSSVDAALATTRTLCDAVEACHAVGVLHRDLKPDNVIRTQDGVLKLVDFGLARDVDPGLSRSRLSVAGQIFGTPGYWAPEQAQGKLNEIGVRTDVYGLGAVLYALLTGRAPCQVETLDALLAESLGPKAAPSSWNPKVPRWLDRVVLRALAPVPADRFASAAELARALEAPRAVSTPAWLAALALVGVGGLAAGAILAWLEPSSEVGSPAPVSRPGEGASPAEADPRGADAAAAEAEPKDARAYVARALARIDLREYDPALADLDRAIALDPDYARAYGVRADLRRKRGMQGALADYDAALRLEPDYLGAYVGRATARGEAGDLQGAIEDYGQVVRLDPTSEAYYNRGVAHGLAGQSRAAIGDYSRALELDPDFVDAWFNRGLRRYTLQDFAGAIADYSEALAREPDATDALGYRSTAYASLRNYAAAIEDAERVLEIDPDDERARTCLAIYRRQLAEGR